MGDIETIARKLEDRRRAEIRTSTANTVNSKRTTPAGEREALEAIIRERDRYREALKRIISMCDVPPRCVCGRPSGLPAVSQVAYSALNTGGRDG